MLRFEIDVKPWLAAIAARSGNGRHEFYRKSLTHKKQLRDTFSDDYPAYLDKNRPREQDEYKKYRKEVYENVFRGYPNRIGRALRYIPEADDFTIQFPTTDVDETKSLATYAGDHYTPEGDLVKWFFTNAVDDYLLDPNAVLLMLPRQMPFSEADYVAPEPQIIPAENVFTHRKGKFTVLVAAEKSLLDSDKPGKPTGAIVYIIDHESFTICTQLSTSSMSNVGGFEVSWNILGMGLEVNPLGEIMQVFTPPLHYCPTLPARKLGLLRKDKNAQGEEWYESMIADALPHIHQAQANQCDIHVEITHHVAATEWRKVTEKCTNDACQDGVVYKYDTQNVIQRASVCPVCAGTKFQPTVSGLGMILVDDTASDSIGRTGVGKRSDGPPGGFISRPIESLKTFVEEYNRNVREAFATINMQFVRNIEDVQSGVAKLYDREEMYRELNTQAAHLCGLLQFLYLCLDCQRFGPSGKAGEQLPSVLVPVRFNIKNAELTRDELNNARDKKWDSTLIEALETKMLTYVAGENSNEYQRYRLRKQLDPYKDLTDEFKIFLMGVAFRNPQSEQNERLIERYYFSIHFDGLVSDALRENPDFWSLTMEQQYDDLVNRNKELVGPQATGMGAVDPNGKPLTINQMTLKPPTDTQEANQVLAENI